MRAWGIGVLAAIAGCSDGGGSADAPPCLCDAAPGAADATAGPSPIEAYDEAWHTTDEAERLALLELAVTDDVEYVDPQNELAGRQALSELMADFQAQVPGGTIPLTSGIDVLGDHWRYAWEVRQADGSVLVAGVDLVVVAGDGRLARIEGYWGIPPGTTPPAELVGLYDAIGDPDATTRGATLAASVADDVMVLTPSATGNDLAALDLWIQTELGAGATFEVPNPPELVQDDLARAFWWRFAGDTEVARGDIYTRASAIDGKIEKVVVFEGDLPPLP